MEIFGALFDEEYESLSTMFDNPNLFVHESFTFPSDNIFSNLDYFNPHSQESCDSTRIDTSALFTISDQHPYNNGAANSFHDHLSIDHNTFESMSFYDGLILPDNAMEETLNLKAERSCTDQNVGSEEDKQLKRKYKEEPASNKSEDFSPECPKKNPHVSRNAQKDLRGEQMSKRKKKVIEYKNNTDEEGINNISIGKSKQSLLSGSSSDQEDRISNGSEEVMNGEGSSCLNPDGKGKASRGSATDPQSLYARRRRERISERLRILQNLVPNGTKVDISTMLEEAVHYVKFLQLQIKLLSSDDMWMYAPVANNGMELGTFYKISTNV